MDAENPKEAFEVEVFQHQGMEECYKDENGKRPSTKVATKSESESGVSTINGNGNSSGRTEAEIENLTSSLLALTSRFAQVQFRVRQIVQSAPEECEKLVKELEKFVFTGVDDDYSCNKTNNIDNVEDFEVDEYGNHEIPGDSEDYYGKMGRIRLRQSLLIQQLREQLLELQDVEKCIDGEEKGDIGDEKESLCN